MKKVLIGIVSLAAVVFLTSPSFGALYDYTWNTPDGGQFGFEAPVLDVLDLSGLPSGDPMVAKAINTEWGLSLDKTPFEKFDGLGGTEGYVTFSSPVEIVLAKWDGNQWAFQLGGYTETFAWKDLDYAMSHVNGYSPVPAPAAFWLLGSGVLGLVAVRRRRS